MATGWPGADPGSPRGQAVGEEVDLPWVGVVGGEDQFVAAAVFEVGDGGVDLVGGGECGGDAVVDPLLSGEGVVGADRVDDSGFGVGTEGVHRRDGDMRSAGAVLGGPGVAQP